MRTGPTGPGREELFHCHDKNLSFENNFSGNDKIHNSRCVVPGQRVFPPLKKRALPLNGYVQGQVSKKACGATLIAFREKGRSRDANTSPLCYGSSRRALLSELSRCWGPPSAVHLSEPHFCRDLSCPGSL